MCGGGSGHEPGHAGFVCNSMLSAAVCGRVFASPPTEEIIQAIEQINSEQGVLIIIKNYTGDIINFQLAMTIARSKGIKVDSIIVGDDIAINPLQPGRGLTGTLLIYKLLSAYSLIKPYPQLADIKNFGESLIKDIKSLGISLQPCTLPGEIMNKTLQEDEMELGLGIHNELGKTKLKIKPINEIIKQILNEFFIIWKDLKACTVLVNNLGATTELEMLIIQKEVLLQLNEKGIIVKRIISGRLLTSLETHGVIITLFKLDTNDENKTNLIVQLLDYPVESKHWMSYTPSQNLKDVYQSQQLVIKEEQQIQSYSEEAKAIISKLENIFIQLKLNEQYLNELDAATGDGDMGAGVTSSVNALISILKSNFLPFDNDLKNTIQQLGQTISKNFGGTSGALYGAFFYAASSQFNAALKQNTFTNFINGINQGMKAIKNVGQAQIGDRTMIDSLEPAISVALELLKNGKSQAEIMKAMLEFAKEGANKAVNLQGKRGRSYYLQGQEIGKKDPGSELICIWISLIIQYFF